jgi:hemophore-related protein
MIKRSLTRLAVAVGGLALSLTAGAGFASADPDLGPIVNTTCTYPQVVSALNAEDPATAAQFNASPMAQSWLRSFLASPPAQRQQMLQQVQSMPGTQQYVGTVEQVANTCNNY